MSRVMPGGWAQAPTPTKWAEIDVAAIRDNARALKRLSGGRSLLMAMVKANGYGHGAATAAGAALAGGADWLGISSIAEGLELRAAGFEVPILNVGWTPPSDTLIAARAGIDITVFTAEAVTAARQAGRQLGHPVRVHWKLDSGMRRLGTPLRDVDQVRDALRAAAPDVTVAGLFTHFASADAEQLDATSRQLEVFIEWTREMGPLFPEALRHCANSAALLRLPDTHLEMTRPGIALYGYAPSKCEGLASLRPAMTVHTVVTQVKRVAAGESIGYGLTWTAPADSLVAMLAGGYADGLDRRNGNQGEVLIGDVVCPLIGQVSMDQAAADVSAVAGVTVGSMVTLLGPSPAGRVDAAANARRIGTIPYEVLCAVSGRVPRVVVNGELVRAG